jgi:hypothetical protein
LPDHTAGEYQRKCQQKDRLAGAAAETEISLHDLDPWANKISLRRPICQDGAEENRFSQTREAIRKRLREFSSFPASYCVTL